MKREAEESSRAKVLVGLRKLVDLFLDSAYRQEVKVTVQDFLRVATALNETEDDEQVEEIRVRWIGKENADEK